MSTVGLSSFTDLMKAKPILLDRSKQWQPTNKLFSTQKNQANIRVETTMLRIKMLKIYYL